MVRPQKDRMVGYNPQISYFKPRGIPLLQLKEVRLTVDEREAIRLSDLLGMSHDEAGQCMGVSRATFGRIIQRARQLVADAPISGKAIQVGGAIIAWLSRIEFFRCRNCRHVWKASIGKDRPRHCPACRQNDFHRLLADPQSNA